MDRLTFAIAPYLATEESFTFANYQFVSLQDLRAYAEGSILEAATVIAGMYHNQMNKPIKRATFIFPLNQTFGEYLGDTSVNEISDMLKVLYLDAFCHLDQLNVVTAENFEVIFYDMRPNDYSLATRSGSVFPTSNLGGDMKKTSYTAPLHIIVDRGNFIPSELISPALAHVAKMRTPSLLNALSFFLQSMKNDERITWLSRTTDLYLAFLMLMKASPDQKERELWWDNLAAISKPGLPTHHYPILDTRDGKLKRHKDLSIAQIWGEEFYKLRCKMLHGDQLHISDFAFSEISGKNLVPNRPGHFYLGANVFPALFFYKFRQEYSGYADPPYLVIDNKENFTSQNYTWLGFDKQNYKLPFYVNDLSLEKAVVKAIKPFHFGS